MSIETNSLNFNITGNGNPMSGFTDNQIVEIPNEKIIENNNQKFIIHEDTIKELAEHISKDGQLSPCIVVPLSDGMYELIDGRHRRRAVIKAGLPTTKCIIRTDLTETQKKSIRLTTNLIRNNDYLPSELAFAYKELFELEGNMQRISEDTNLNKKKIYRYIRLTNLIKPLLDRVDNGNIPVIAAVELSYLTEQEQKKLFKFLLNHSDCKVTTDIARKVKNNFQNLEYYFWQANPEEYLKSDNSLSVHSEAPIEEKTEYQTDKLSTSIQGYTSAEKKSKKGISSENDTSEANSDTDESVDNLSNAPSYAIEEITKHFIENTHADKLIITKFYSTNELIDYIKKYYVNAGSCCSEYSCSFKNKFEIELRTDGLRFRYCISYKELDTLTRNYIRENYTKEQIKNILFNEN